MTSAVLRSAQAGAILTALGLSAGLMTGVAEAKPQPGEHFCTSPIFGGPADLPVVQKWVDLNQRYGVRDRIIGPPAPAWDETDVGADTDPLKRDGCLELFVKESWVRAVAPWLTATTAQRDEFNARFDSARYVIDEGTGQQQIVKADKHSLFTGSVPNVEGLTPPWTRGLPFIVPVSPALPKLSQTDGCTPAANPAVPGPCHTSTLYVTMTPGAPVCNGIKEDPNITLPPDNPNGNSPGLSTNCLPGGTESKWPLLANWSFSVSPEPTGN
jgi:hypothetical protein